MIKIILIFLMTTSTAMANEVTSGDSDSNLTTQAPSSAPKCIRDERSINLIMTTQRNNRKNNDKYNGYRQVLQGHEDADLMARLIYAETLAAQCSTHNQDVAKNIAYVVHNRIKEQGRITNVLFDRRDQFASSMNNYGSSQYREFLCPSQLGFFQEILSLSEGLLSGNVNNPTQANAVNYYLHRHWGEYKGNPTNWGKWPKEARVPNVEAPCLSVYRRP